MKNSKSIIRLLTLILIFGTIQSKAINDSKEVKDSLKPKIDAMVSQMGLSKETPGGIVGIMKDGQLIFKQAYGVSNFESKELNTTSTLFNLGSVSKQFTAAAILLLEREGKLSLKDNIRKYLPDFPDYGHPVSIENLIHHTSGVKSYDVLQLMAGKSIENKDTMEEIYNLIINQRSLNNQPNAEYIYSNSGYILLAKIVEKASGKTFSQYVEEKLLRAIGMNQSFIYDSRDKINKKSATPHQPDTNHKFKIVDDLDILTFGESNVFTTIDDYLLWDNNFYQNKLGEWDFNKAMTSQVTLTNGDTCHYAFGLNKSLYKGLTTISHQGGTLGFSTQYIQIPSERLSVVCMFNVHTNVTNLAYQIIDLFIEGETKQDETTTQLKKARVDSTILHNYAGRYICETDWFGINISQESDHLIYEDAGNNRFEIYPSSNISFFVDFADLTFNFKKNKKGETKGLTLLQGNEIYNFTYCGTDTPSIKQEQLLQYIGDFYCKDIDITYPVILKDKKLHIKFPELTAHYCGINVETELIYEYGDCFTSPISSLKFIRNNQDEISGFIIKDLGRVRNLVFKKLE
ncbi:serine hydrolase [Marinilabiliaceae bacterium JC017]|nr:serine hydrolase [Marinilabiliaceae bacterium JC017]